MKRDWKRLHRDACCFIPIDGAEQSSFWLPHFVISIDNDNSSHLYTVTELHKTGTSHILYALHIFNKEKPAKSSFPPKLYSQLNISLLEKKNKYLFAYAESHVPWRVFAKVEAPFLSVRQTFEGIDQAFSKISHYLDRNCAAAIVDLHQQLCKTWKKMPLVTLGWLQISRSCANI